MQTKITIIQSNSIAVLLSVPPTWRQYFLSAEVRLYGSPLLFTIPVSFMLVILQSRFASAFATPPYPPTITTIHKSVCFSPLLFISIQDLSSVSTLITFASSSFYLFLCTSYFLVRKLILSVGMTIQFVVVSTMVRMHH